MYSLHKNRVVNNFVSTSKLCFSKAQFVCYERQDQISIDNITVVVLLPMLPLPRLLLSLISSQTFGVENYAETFQKKDLYRF